MNSQTDTDRKEVKRWERGRGVPVLGAVLKDIRVDEQRESAIC